jgi:hypothetical protein
MKPIVVAGILASASAVCHGADLDYQCVITQELHLEAGGSLKRFAKPINIGERFAVDRDTGRVTGGPFMRSAITRTTLVHRGGNATAFKAIYTQLGDVEVLQVEEFAPGKDKPFVAVTLLTVLAGVCT